MRRAGAGHAALAAAALTLGACGEDRSTAVSTETDPPPPRAAPAPQQPAEAPPAKVNVSESEFRLEPARIRVDRPATLEIRVRNTGARRHALDVEAPAGSLRTRTLEPGASETLTVELAKPGRYRWHCPVGDHERRGMRGTIQVARGGG